MMGIIIIISTILFNGISVLSMRRAGEHTPKTFYDSFVVVFFCILLQPILVLSLCSLSLHLLAFSPLAKCDFFFFYLSVGLCIFERTSGNMVMC